jgi:hypothetical protein
MLISLAGEGGAINRRASIPSQRVVFATGKRAHGAIAGAEGSHFISFIGGQRGLVTGR